MIIYSQIINGFIYLRRLYVQTFANFLKKPCKKINLVEPYPNRRTFSISLYMIELVLSSSKKNSL